MESRPHFARAVAAFEPFPRNMDATVRSVIPQPSSDPLSSRPLPSRLVVSSDRGPDAASGTFRSRRHRSRRRGRRRLPVRSRRRLARGPTLRRSLLRPGGRRADPSRRALVRVRGRPLLPRVSGRGRQRRPPHPSLRGGSRLPLNIHRPARVPPRGTLRTPAPRRWLLYVLLQRVRRHVWRASPDVRRRRAQPPPRRQSLGRRRRRRDPGRLRQGARAGSRTGSNARDTAR